MAKRAIITGITGQDGSYLAELLLDKGYEVTGIVRRLSAPNFWRIEHLLDRITLRPADLLDQLSLIRVIQDVRPHEFYNLAAMSFVPASWDQPLLTGEFNSQGVTRVLEAIRQVDPASASTRRRRARCTGACARCRRRRLTPFYPRSPYGVSKVFGHYITVNYRESYGIFAVSGILFNHESPRRGLEFVTRKVTDGVARIKLGLADHLALGNLDACRDWGFAGDYVRAMWLMLQQDTADDYVIATGISHSVRAARRDRLRSCRPRLAEVRASRSCVPASGRSRSSDWRREQGAARARVGAGGQFRAADRDDGRRRPRASAGSARSRRGASHRRYGEPEGEDSRSQGADRCHRPRLRRAAAGRGVCEEGFDVTGFDVDVSKVDEINAGRSYILDVKTEDVAVSGEGGPPARDDRHVAAARHGRHRHLRADAAPQDARPRSLLRRPGGRFGEGAPEAGPARHPRVDHLSGHDRRGGAAGARGERAEGGRGLLPGVLARARRSGQSSRTARARSRRSSAASTRRAPSWPPISTARSSTPSSRSARRRWPRWSSCSRTRSAR